MATKKQRGAASAASAPDPDKIHHAMWPRQATPGEEFDSEPLRGPKVHLAADENGMVPLSSPEEVQFADELHLAAWGSEIPATSAPAEDSLESSDETEAPKGEEE